MIDSSDQGAGSSHHGGLWGWQSLNRWGGGAAEVPTTSVPPVAAEGIGPLLSTPWDWNWIAWLDFLADCFIMSAVFQLPTMPTAAAATDADVSWGGGSSPQYGVPVSSLLLMIALAAVSLVVRLRLW
jgi:hypothetical protein